jgi:hypothetical protein
MTILCLCREEHDWKLIPGYADAFRRRGIEFFCVDDSIPFDAPLEDVLRTCPSPPSAIFHFESAHPLFPIGLERSQIPTMCFHPDTHAFTERRIRWSVVFDHVAVFHPGYVSGLPAPDIRAPFYYPMLSGVSFLMAQSCRANSKSVGSARQAAAITKPAPNGCRGLRTNFTLMIGRVLTPLRKSRTFTDGPESW